MKVPNFKNLQDDKAFNISLIASLLTVFFMIMVELLHHYFGKFVPLEIIWLKWALFVGLGVWLLIQLHRYQQLDEVQAQLDVTKKN